ncbi:hypothetical protein CsSME_00024975 [Camellia sinensis var. sinensis]
MDKICYPSSFWVSVSSPFRGIPFIIIIIIGEISKSVGQWEANLIFSVVQVYHVWGASPFLYRVQVFPVHPKDSPIYFSFFILYEGSVCYILCKIYLCFCFSFLGRPHNVLFFPLMKQNVMQNRIKEHTFIKGWEFTMAVVIGSIFSHKFLLAMVLSHST